MSCSRTTGDKYFYPDQYNNEANWRAHYEGTAPEIWEQSAGRITHFLAGLGTSGTFMGTTRKLKELNPAIQAVSMQPESPLHGLEGLKHMATAMVPGIYDASLADLQVEVATEDAQEMVRRLAREEGLLVGPSSGANVFAACDWRERCRVIQWSSRFCAMAASATRSSSHRLQSVILAFDRVNSKSLVNASISSSETEVLSDQ